MKHFSWTALLAAASLTAAFGQEPTPSASPEELLLGDVTTVTTATKTPERINDAPAAVTVITEEEIRKSGATNVPDLLRSVPGVDVMEINHTQQNVAFRGFNDLFSNKILVMVDGRSIYQDFYGAIFWNTEPLLISQIRRIEVVRGPGSVLYGANAFSGVVNIITKTPQEMAARLRGKPNASGALSSAIAARGEHGSTLAEGLASGLAGNGLAWTVGLGYHATDGYGDRRPGQVRDADRVSILTADLQKTLPRGSARLTLANADAVSDQAVLETIYDAHWHTRSARFEYRDDTGQTPWSFLAFANHFGVNGGSLPSSSIETAPPDLKTDTVGVQWQQQRDIALRHQIVYGVDYRATGVQSSVTGPDRHTQRLWSVYLQGRSQIGPKTLFFGGIRLDHHSVYGEMISPRVSLVHHPTADQSVRLSYGEAFRAPTLLNNYLDESFPIGYGLTFQSIGNLNLRPERIRSVDLGYRKELPRGHVGLSLFTNWLSDRIASQTVGFAPAPYPPGIPVMAQYRNVGSGTAQGVELEGEYALAHDWKVTGNYAYENVLGTDGHQRSFTPRHKVSLGVQGEGRGPWSLWMVAHFVDAWKDSGVADPPTVPAYLRVDARVGYRFGSVQEPWTVAVSATNLFGGHREFPTYPADVSGQPQTARLDRTGWVSLEKRW